jgi:hypothetical protein
LQGGELGLDLFALVVEFGEPGDDPGSHAGRCGVGRLGRELFQADDLGVLRGVELLDPGGQGSPLLVAAGLGVGVGGGELGGEQRGPAEADDVLGEEQGDDLVQLLSRGFTVWGWPGQHYDEATAFPASMKLPAAA